jgi:uncharacterized membrane protein YhiD involved in acid resistance
MQTIVGTAAAQILPISKYGFSDVLSAGTVVLDPWRVAAQIVSGIGFLGAGIILGFMPVARRLAAQFVSELVDVDGIKVPTRRRAYRCVTLSV